jgi:hypothetical protein
MTIPGDTTLVPPTPSSPGEAAQSVASTAKDEGRAVAETAKSETARLASEVRTEARKQGDEQARRVADWAQDIGSQLEGVRRGEAPQGPVADVLAEVGSRANQFAERLQTGGIDEVARDVKQFARQRPAVFLLGTFALGVVAGRTLRNADTHALVEAAKPSESGSSAPGAWEPTSGSGQASAAYSPPGGSSSASSEPYAR